MRAAPLAQALLAAGWVALTLACGRAEPPAEPGAGTEAAGADSAALAAAADSAARAEADPRELVGEIRHGIHELPAMTALDPVAARRRAIELYSTRQEALEARWGPRGADSPSPAAAQAVLDAETSFHELLALLNQAAAPDSAAVAAAVSALDDRYDQVLAAAGGTP